MWISMNNLVVFFFLLVSDEQHFFFRKRCCCYCCFGLISVQKGGKECNAFEGHRRSLSILSLLRAKKKKKRGLNVTCSVSPLQEVRSYEKKSRILHLFFYYFFHLSKKFFLLPFSHNMLYKKKIKISIVTNDVITLNKSIK